MAAFLSRDNSPDKDYFNQMMIDAIAVWEGQRNIASSLQNTIGWQWGIILLEIALGYFKIKNTAN